jgi:pimeloyl-ACP methyl ester carboxylesterase
MFVKPLFDAKFTVYGVDRRGRGQTSATEGHTIPDEGEDIAAVISAIGEPVFLLGHSFGAHVALAAAALVPDQVRKLVLYEPPLPEAMSRELLERLQATARRGDDDAMVEDFLLNGPKLPAEEITMIRSTPIWAMLVSDAQNSIREWPALVNYDFDARNFSSLNIPVLLLTGSESPPGVYATQQLAASLPNSRVTVIERQGHEAQAMAAQEFAQIVTSFVEEGAKQPAL